MLGVYYLSFTSHSNIPHYAVYAFEVVSLNKQRIEEFCILEYNTFSPPKIIRRFGGTYRLYLHGLATDFMLVDMFLRNVSPIFMAEETKTGRGILCWLSFWHILVALSDSFLVGFFIVVSSCTLPRLALQDAVSL